MRRPARRSVVRIVAAGAATATLLLGASACGDDGDSESSSEPAEEPGVVVDEASDEPEDAADDETDEVAEDGSDLPEFNPIEVNDELGPDFPIDEIPVIDGENTELVEAGGWLVTTDISGEMDAIYEAATVLLQDADFEVGPDSTTNSGNWSNQDWSIELVTYPSDQEGFVTVQYGITPN